jgi:hypothetical protein
MDDELSSASIQPRPEPIAFTLADLAALVLGVALVAALPWYTRPNLQLGGVPSAWWYAPLHLAREGIGKACLALVPVILARCALYRRVARAAELLGAFCGMPWLTIAIDRLPSMRIVQRVPGVASAPALQVVNGALYWHWKEGLLAVALMAVLAVPLGRKRLPGWALSALLIVAWLGLHDFVGLLLELDPSLVVALRLNEVAAGLITFCVVGPILILLYAVPAIAAILNADRRTWLEWTALSLAASLFLTSEIVFHATDWSTGQPSLLWQVELVFVTVLLGSIALGVLLVRRLGPAWTCWLAPG